MQTRGQVSWQWKMIGIRKSIEYLEQFLHCWMEAPNASTHGNSEASSFVGSKVLVFNPLMRIDFNVVTHKWIWGNSVTRSIFRSRRMRHPSGTRKAHDASQLQERLTMCCNLSALAKNLPVRQSGAHALLKGGGLKALTEYKATPRSNCTTEVLVCEMENHYNTLGCHRNILSKRLPYGER